MTTIRMPARLFATLLLIVALMVLVSGARLTVAGVAAYQAEAFMMHWTAQAQVQARAQQPLSEPDATAWRVAAAAARRAVMAYPVASGDYLDRLGRVQAWQQFLQPAGSADAMASRHEALQAYRDAAQARKTRPDTYARLAHIKMWLGERDSEFEAALAAADRLGSYCAQINEEIADISLAAWPVLAAAQRERGERHALRLLKQGPQGAQRLLALGRAYGLPAGVCATVKETAAFQSVCPPVPSG